MNREIELGYGSSFIKFVTDERRFSIIADDTKSSPPLSDAQIGAAFDSPIASPPLDEIVDSDDSVLLVVSDATRHCQRADCEPRRPPPGPDRRLGR